MNTNTIGEGTVLDNDATIRLMPIASFIFDKAGTLTPQPDITPLESLHISIMFGAAYVRGQWWDYKEYVTRNKLERHFTNE